MATSAFKSTTKRAPVATSEDSPDSSSSKSHRRSRSLSRFSRPVPVTNEVVVPTPRRKFVNTIRGSDFAEVSLDDLAIEFFDTGKENNTNSSELDDYDDVDVESVVSSRSRIGRSRSVSRHPNGAKVVSGGVSDVNQRRGRSVSRRNDVNGNGSGSGYNGGGTGRVVVNGDSRRRRSVSVARHQISDSESDIDLSRSSASRSKSRNINNANSRVASFQRPTASSHRRITRSTSQAPQLRSHDDDASDIDLSRSSASQSKSNINNANNRVASFQRPTASSHRRITRSMSQAPQLRSHDDYSSQSSALTDDDLRDARFGRNDIEKTIRAVYAQKKIDHPTGDVANNGLNEAMWKELWSAVNEIMIEREQTMERKPSKLSVHDRLYSNKSDGPQLISTTRKNYSTKIKQPERTLEEQQNPDGYKIVREVLPESKSNGNAQKISYPRKRSNDRNRVSRRLNEEAEKYFEDFISNVEDTDFSSSDGERSDTSSSLVGTTKQRDGALLPTQNGNSVPVEMEGVNLPWLKWDDKDGIQSPPPKTPKTKLWNPSQDLELIREQGNQSNSSQGSWNPATANSTNGRAGIFKETKKTLQFDMDTYLELKRSEEILFDIWMERSIISSGGLLLCNVVVPF